MKRLLALLLAAVMTLSLCACGGGNGAPKQESGTTNEQVETSTQGNQEVASDNKAEGGIAAISHYYITAPKIVDAIDRSSDSKAIYDTIYAEVIVPCVKFIENQQFENAFNLYKEAVLRFEQDYTIIPA